MSLPGGRFTSFLTFSWSGGHEREDSSVIFRLMVAVVVLTTGKRKPGWSVAGVMEMELVRPARDCGVTLLFGGGGSEVN